MRYAYFLWLFFMTATVSAKDTGNILLCKIIDLTGTSREYSVPVGTIPAGVYIVQQDLEGETVRTDKVVITP